MSCLYPDINSSGFREPGSLEFDSLEDNELVEISRCRANSVIGKRAVSTLISRYMRLVRKKAYGFARDYAEPEDLAQEGFLSFLNAVNSFDPKRGSKFSSFADACVTNGIKSAAVRMRKNAEQGSAENFEGNAEDGSSASLSLLSEFSIAAFLSAGILSPSS